MVIWFFLFSSASQFRVVEKEKVCCVCLALSTIAAHITHIIL